MDVEKGSTKTIKDQIEMVLFSEILIQLTLDLFLGED